MALNFGLGKKISGWFTTKEGEKTRLHTVKVGAMLGGVVVVLFVINIVGGGEADTSVVKRMAGKQGSKVRKEDQAERIDEDVAKLLRSPQTTEAKSSATQASQAPKNIKYKAKQLLLSPQSGADEHALPPGSNMIGKLLTAIDSRDASQIYKISLPYGAKHKGSLKIPKGTELHARLSYPGKGEKVYLSVFRLVLPSGVEQAIKADVLDSKDYSTGLTGAFHGKAGARLVSGLALTMISAAAETMTEKESLGKSQAITPKASLKNAGYQGLAKVSEAESTRQLGELAAEKEYVTIGAGRDLIVSLRERFSFANSEVNR